MTAPSTYGQRSRNMANSSNGNGSRNYPADTAKQRFIQEIYNKETAIRLGWYFNTRQPDGSHLSTSLRQKEVNRKRIEDACPRPSSGLRGLRDRYQPAADFRKRSFNHDGRPVAGDWPVASALLPPVDPLPDMIPGDPETKERLYNGLSHDGKGRIDYLRTRSKLLAPEKRYEVPPTTSFEYGWHVEGAMDEPMKPQHARAKLVRDTFYARNGINTLQLPLVK